MHVSVKLGKYVHTEAIGIMESSDSSKRNPPSVYPKPKSTVEHIYRPVISRGISPSAPRTQPSRWQNEDKGAEFRNPEPSRLYYPVVYKGSYTCEFKKIPHSELQKVSRIEIKVIDE
jgi:hypothetical protein